MIQPSLTGLVHALFATQHRWAIIRSSLRDFTLQTAVAARGLERNAHHTERLWVRPCRDSASRQSLDADESRARPPRPINASATPRRSTPIPRLTSAAYPRSRAIPT